MARRMALQFALLTLWVVVCSGPGYCGTSQESEKPIVFRTVREIRLMPKSEATKPHKALLRGVVTFFDPVRKTLFVQDGTGGIYVGDASSLRVRAGDLVLLTGDVVFSDYAPEIGRPHVEVLGRRPLPAPLPVSFDDLTSTREDSQFVAAEGIIRSASEESPRNYATPFVDRYGGGWSDEPVRRGRLRLELAIGVGRAAVTRWTSIGHAFRN